MGDELTTLRATARGILLAGLEQAAAGPATARSLAAHPPVAPAEGGRRLIIAAGRFARDMALEALVATGPCETLIVTEADQAAPVEGARVFAVNWPAPDLSNVRAAAAIEAALGRMRGGDAVLVLLSVGAERMLLAPAEGIAPGDLDDVERLMRKAGAGAGEAALVRQQLSRFEGGGLLRAAPAVAFTALAVCDGTAAEDPRRIAGGMVAHPLGSRVTARALTDLYGLTDRLPERVRRHLAAPPPSLPATPRPRVRIVASNAQAVAAMAAAGARAFSRPLGGGALEMVHDILAVAAGLGPGNAAAFGLESPEIWRGQEGDTEMACGYAPSIGEGGDMLTLTAPIIAGAAGPRHADLGLRFALLARDRRLRGPWSLIVTSTGGEGPGPRTPGVSVQSDTLARLHAVGIDAEVALAHGRAMEALERIGAGVSFGKTGTDVGDLAVFVRG